ncbi:MAG: Hsp20/alpha crystallin family protein [Rhodopirellula sp.]|nr:Hsp20/alpha crystallin family protein [Rhodopirellula sp.]
MAWPLLAVKVGHTAKEVMEMGFVPRKNKHREGESMASSFANLRGEIDRILESYVREPLSGIEWPFGLQRGCVPPVDVAENPEEFVIRAEIPGVDPEEIDLTVSGGQLVFSGDKRNVWEGSGKDFFHTECRFGHFRRVIPLPQTVDGENAEAEYVHGVLTVRLKKVASSPPKRVSIKLKQFEAAPPAPTSSVDAEDIPPAT